MKWRGHDFDLLDVVTDPVWFWTLFGTYEGEPIVFEPWQVAHLHDGSRFRAREKAPQIGFSWLSALEATWDCLLFEDATDGFVSVDQREASEKVLYAKKAYAELPEALQQWVPMVKDSTEELWFGDTSRPSRLMSIPATSALRGRRMSVFLDEIDFYRDGGKDAHRVALTRVTRGGRVTMGSTCFGVDTQLDQTMQKGPNFSKARLPHTVATKPEIRESIEIAQQELDEADFDEEYGCVRGGASSVDFPEALIRECQHGDAPMSRDDLPTRERMVAAYDVAGGTGRHPAMLSVARQLGDVWREIVLEEVRDVTLPEQEKMLHALMREHPHLTLVIDAGGVGRQAAQALTAAFPNRVVSMIVGSKPDDGPPMDKAEMAIALKRSLQASELQLIVDKERMLQFRRTRIEKGSTGKQTVVQPGAKKTTHYDKFWVTAYLQYGISGGGADTVYNHRGLIVIGGK